MERAKQKLLNNGIWLQMEIVFQFLAVFFTNGGQKTGSMNAWTPNENAPDCIFAHTFRLQRV